MRAPARSIVVAGLLLGLLLPAAPTWAHSFLRDAAPEPGEVVQSPPTRITLWFDEPVEAEFAEIAVANRRGRSFGTGPPRALTGRDTALVARLPRELRAGRYVVTWRVVSTDSHIQSGQFRFRVAAAAQRKGPAESAGAASTTGSPTPGDTDAAAGAGAGPGQPARADDGLMVSDESHAAWATTTARGLTMAGLLLLVGLTVFWLLAWRGPRAALAPPGDVQLAFVRRWQRIATVALGITITGTVAGVVVQGAAAANQPFAAALRPEVISGVLATGFGKAAVGRLVLLELLAIVAILWRSLPLFTAVRPVRAVGAAALEPGGGTVAWIMMTAIVVPLLLTISTVGHAATATPLVAHLAADAVHFAAAGAWIGGLLVLSLAAFPATRGLAAEERVRVLGPPVVRFSRIAAVSVLLVVVTGTYRGIDTVGGWAGLTQTGYGRALLVKLGIFGALMSLGAFNHFWAVRRIRAAAAAGTHTRALNALRRSVTAETLLAVAVVVATAILVSLPMAAG